MIIWSWIGALLIGLTLGLLGSGGSILTVPVLVYLVGEPEKLAIAESLGIVTIISLVGAIPFALKKLVDWRSVLLFGIPGMAGAYGGAYLSKFMSGTAQLSLFAAVMLLAAAMMFWKRSPADYGGGASHAAWKIILEGLVVGVLTGLVGVGGGFLIVPALVLLGGLPIRLAVGTSLAIIALKSLSGFYKYIDVLAEAGMAIDWNLVLVFGGIGIVGSFAGKKVGDYLSQEHLKTGFAVFLVAMSAFILLQNTTLLFGQPGASDGVVAHIQSESEDSTMFAPLKHLFGGSSDRLSAEEFKLKRTDDAVVVDVRTPAEYAGGHVADAENIDLQSPDFHARVASLDRDKTYYLYCRTGNRSGTAARTMRELGFDNVYNVGGLDSLERADVKTVR